MKRGEVIQGVGESIRFPNRGIVRGGEEKFCVKNVLPGQTVEIRVGRRRGGMREGTLVRVLRPSPLETKGDPCPHCARCGGCLYQTLPYERQLTIKETQVRELLEEVLEGPLPMDPIRSSPRPEEYRNKMEFSFGDAEKDGPLTLGLHARGSFYDVVTVDGCRIVDRDFRRILRKVLDYMTEKKIPYYGKKTHTGFLRHLLVRKAAKTGEILIDLVTASGYQPEEDFVSGLLALPLDGTVTGILHTVNDSLGDVVQNDGTDVLYGRDFLREELLGLTFRITPFSFFQTNSLGAEVLYEVVRAYVGDTEGRKIYDLYTGTGTIAQILAPVADEVVGVEIVPEAVEAARTGAALNGLKNCQFIVGDVLKVLDSLTESPDILVLDPPREGVHPKAMGKILAYGVPRVVYVSCKPTSLVRDLRAFQNAGYTVTRLQCVDLFPSTANVETVCLLEGK